jgi:hypothetical protein
VKPAAMLLLAPVAIVAGVLASPFVPSGADPFGIVRDRIGAATELPHVVDPHARGEDVCLRKLPPELPDTKFQPRWRMCEAWELEAKMRRARASDTAMPPRPGW